MNLSARMNTPPLFSALAVLWLLLLSTPLLAQDTLVFDGNYRIPVFIEEENEYEVIYRRSGYYADSLLFVFEKRFITRIEYQDPSSAKAKFKSKPINWSALDVWVLPYDTAVYTIKGRLLYLDDTILHLRRKTSLIEVPFGAKPDIVNAFSYDQIHQIAYRRKDKVTRMALIGSASGMVLGTLTGLIVFKATAPCNTIGIDGKPDCDPGLKSPMTRFEKSLLLGAGTSVAGFFGGGLIGSVRVKILIGGKKDRYNQAIPRLIQHLN